METIWEGQLTENCRIVRPSLLTFAFLLGPERDHLCINFLIYGIEVMQF